MNCKLPDVQAGFRKDRGTRDQIANIHWIIEKARAFQKNIYFCIIDYAKAFDCVDHNKLWKILKGMGIPDHPTCLLRNLYAGQEATVSLCFCGVLVWGEPVLYFSPFPLVQSFPTVVLSFCPLLLDDHGTLATQGCQELYTACRVWATC